MITIVSGLPRSGTSLMMQMLAAGGMSVLTDHERRPDVDNPRGYYEWEPAKQLPKQPDRIAEAEGKVVKIISQLLLALPPGRDYRVIFMHRPMAEVLASQDEMLRRRGTYEEGVEQEAIISAFEAHLRKVNAWLETRSDIAVLRVSYHAVLRDPRGVAETVQRFLGLGLDLEAMIRQIDASLYRQRSGSSVMGK